MTLPLWGLWVFIIWTILLVVLLIAKRVQHLMTGGSPADFGDPTDNTLLWRLYRAQVNCAENLPLYAGAIFILEVRNVTNSVVDSLAVTYIIFRIAHSLIHIFGFDPKYRVACLGVQFLCLLGLLIYGVI
ncbi:MAG: MAPEG family protein [Okeania sp. SIO2H7]|nr:MAPEG family protein [Okeania sp. SIO2H7]